MQPDQATRDRARGIFAYLKSFVELRTKVIRSVEQYEDAVWLSDVPREPGCRCESWNWGRQGEDPDVWIEVKRPLLPDPPTPPESIRKWLLREEWTSSKIELPVLQTTILEPPAAEGEPARLLRLQDFPELKEKWEQYVEEKWWPWQAEERRLRPVFELYSRLFGIHQQMMSSGEQYELVLGYGLLSGVATKGQRVRRHLLTARANIHFEARRGLLTIGPPGDGSRLRLEQDMLDPEDRPHPKDLQDLERELGELGESVWNAQGIRQILQAWAHNYSADCSFLEMLECPPESTRPAAIVLAPALIFRRRSDRSWVTAFNEILSQIDSGADLPAGVARFASRPEDTDGTLETELTEISGSGEVYFPLPANDEQRRIIERLDASAGVVVQGPPGTGKSHTIVNLVCHLLAGGKRVLVTSHTARALRVLKKYIGEKVPAVAPLAVLQLGEGPEALSEMERSVQGITTKHHTWNRESSIRSIRSGEARLEAARNEQALALRVLRDCRERETFRHDQVAGRYSGTLAEIASRLREERPHLCWLPDEDRIDVPCPISDGQFGELCEGLSNWDVVERSKDPWVVPERGNLPSGHDLAEVLQRREAAERRLELLTRGIDRHLVDRVRSLPPEVRRDHSEDVNTALVSVRELRGTRIEWAVQALRELSTGLVVKWEGLLEATEKALSLLLADLEWYDRTPVSWPAGMDLHRIKAGAEELKEHFARGGWAGLFGPIRPEVVRRNEFFRKNVSIGGRPCWSADQLEQLLRWISSHELVSSLRKRWHGVLGQDPGGDVEAVATFRDSKRILERAVAVAGQVRSLREELSVVLELGERDWTAPELLQDVQNAFGGADAADELDALSARVKAISDLLEAPKGAKRVAPSWTVLRNAVEKTDLATYKDGLELAGSEYEIQRRADAFRGILTRLRSAAPRLAAGLEAGDSSLTSASHPEGLEAAWAWRRAWSWLRDRIDPTSDERARLALDDADKRVRALISEIAAEQAWLHCFERLTRHEQEHLVAWSHSVRKIGKGTGKYAAQHRDEARLHLSKCRSAIPAWVMPLYRVAETVSPAPHAFDVAIIDEASQSGPEALILGFLARKVVVVGDDQQISPTYVGLDRESVLRLRDEHLNGVEHNDHFGTESSFFTLANIRFPGRVRLREHFRCMPEIIGFSNDLSYADAPLLPLRQFGSARLTPVVEAVFVEAGFMKGSGQKMSNPGEVAAIVAWIARALQDPAYAGKSIGVISLRGDWQAREIERALVAEVGPEAFEERQIVCGDAYAFQGDERDVILLSMVAAPSETQPIGVLSKEDDRRRFNVAASRARDQMVLFHSVRLADLSQKCFRHRLLSYCMNPSRARWVTPDLPVSELRVRASRSDRGSMRPPDPFESWFEVDVYLRLIARDLRVTPQFEAHGYRIDLVVETPRDRIAVECDGSEWHGPERADADLGRQRELERCGWTFYRVPESGFRLDPDQALEGLWQVLKSREGHVERPVESEGRPEKGRAQSVGTSTGPDSTAVVQAVSRGEAPGDDQNPEDYPEAAPSTERASGALGKGDPGRSGEESTHTGAKALSADVEYRGSRAPETYASWKPRRLPDPLSSRLEDLLDGLVEIVAAEGPVLGDRLARLYVVAAGGHRAGKRLRERIAAAVKTATRNGQLSIRKDFDSTGFESWVVHLPDSPGVKLRERGPRDFDEIPSSELEQMMAMLQQEAPRLKGETLFRLVISKFGFGRTTENMFTRLKAIASRREAALGKQQTLGLDSVN